MPTPMSGPALAGVHRELTIQMPCQMYGGHLALFFLFFFFSKGPRLGLNQHLDLHAYTTTSIGSNKTRSEQKAKMSSVATTTVVVQVYNCIPRSYSRALFSS